MLCAVEGEIIGACSFAPLNSSCRFQSSTEKVSGGGLSGFWLEFVGSDVGKIWLTRHGSSQVINSFNGKCWECRVSVGGEIPTKSDHLFRSMLLSGDGQHPYKEAKCFVVSEDETRAKYGAHAAHCPDHVDR